MECGPAEVDPLPVLPLGTRTGASYVQLHLTWAQSERLVNMLADADKR